MLAAVQYGIAVAQIYRAANNPLVDRMIARFRGAAGELIPKGAVAARRAIAVLRRGGHLTMLADQKMNDGIPVPFFGRPAMTASALAVLALRFDCDVLPARVERLAGRAVSADHLPAAAVTAQRRPSCRRCRSDDARSIAPWKAGSATAPQSGSGSTAAGRISRRRVRPAAPRRRRCRRWLRARTSSGSEARRSLRR